MPLSPMLISLPLAKYSRAVDVTPDVQQFTWNHSVQDLIVVFDTFRGAEDADGLPMQTLKVVQGTQVLEVVPVAELIGQAHQITVTMRNLNVAVRNEQLPISAIVRCPLLAIRYNLRDGKVRRIQLKFMTSQDFDEAYNHLRVLGLRMTSTGPQPSPSDTSNSPQIDHPSSSGPSCPPSRLAEVSSRPYTAASMQSSKISSSVPRTSSPLAQRPLTMHSSPELQHSTADFNRPVSSYSAPMNTDSGPQLSTNQSLPAPLVPPEYFQRPESASSGLEYASPSLGASRASFHVPTVESVLGPSPARPQSAVPLPRPDSANASLPPRRELPFARQPTPKSAGSDSSRPLSRSSYSPMAPPPVQTAGDSTGLDQQSSGSTGETFTNTAPASEAGLPPLPRPTFIQERGNQVQTVSTPTTMTQAPPTPPILTDLNSTQNLPSSLSPTPQTCPIAPVAASYDRVVSAITQDLTTNPNAKENLAAYAMQSVDGRMAVLNDFMMQNLEDDNFLNLLEDVEVCWVRVCLGTR